MNIGFAVRLAWIYVMAVLNSQAMRSWANYLPPLSLFSLTCKVGLIIVSISKDYHEDSMRKSAELSPAQGTE